MPTCYILMPDNTLWLPGLDETSFLCEWFWSKQMR
jgi:hypothetical protein